jgi:hypothetical protein
MAATRAPAGLTPIEGYRPLVIVVACYATFMRRTLSSPQTFVMKFILPALCLTGFAAAAVLLRHSPPADGRWQFLGVTVLAAVFLYRSCIRVKRVAMDERWLYVSNYVREIRVPLEEINAVWDNRSIHCGLITVGFSRDTELGSRITFIPRMRWWGSFRPHPVVAEIESASRQARR